MQGRERLGVNRGLGLYTERCVLYRARRQGDPTSSGGIPIHCLDYRESIEKVRRDAMAARKRRGRRDIERDYPTKQFVSKLRRLANCLENGSRFRIQVAGERVSIPASARISIEHERGSSQEEIEIQLKWPLDD